MVSKHIIHPLLYSMYVQLLVYLYDVLLLAEYDWLEGRLASDLLYISL